MKESDQGPRSTVIPTIADMHAEIAATPGAIGHNAIELVRRYLYVFVGNAMELKAHLESLRDPAVSLPVISNVPEHQAAGEVFDRELIRRLHNFVSSVKSLIEHSRNLVRKMYPSGELRAEYDKRAAAFAANPRRRLVQQLREYVLHNRLPPTIESSSFSRVDEGFEMTTSVALDYEILLEHGKWDADVRELLRSGEKLDLLELVDEYLDQVAEMYLWFIEAQFREHRADIDATNAMIEEFKRQVGQPREWDPPKTSA